MKFGTTLVTVALVSAMSASSAFAGGLAPAVEETEMIVDVPAATGSLGQVVVPIILLGLLAVASSSGGSDGDDSGGSSLTDGPL